MTKEKFLKLLAEVQYPWENRGGNIRSGCHCPITAVCAFHYQQNYQSDQVEFAAGVIELSEEDANDIIDAADNCGNLEDGLRDKLLKVCGLV